eukprot:jgi/Chlat1/7625/Chrsp64S07106
MGRGGKEEAEESVLVVNAGSSSVKYALYVTQDGGGHLKCKAQGSIDAIGTSDSEIKHKRISDSDGDADKDTEKAEIKDYKDALHKVLEKLDISDPSTISAVGHRVVHGREIEQPVAIDNEIKEDIKSASALAPLHNPHHLEAIEIAQEIFPCTHVAVFDTAFHATMPPKAYTYAVPRDLASEVGLRRYGFHGTSYMHLTKKAAEHLGKDEDAVNLIIMHLGAGASVCAVKGGKSVDTSMGVTPLEGLVMATRSGDIDPAVYGLLKRQKGMDVDAVDELLNKKSGLLGLCGEKDLRNIDERARKGDKDAQLAIEVMVYSIRKYVGAYLVHLDGEVDALVFSAGIGEHSAVVRKSVCAGMAWAGIALDAEKNSAVAGKKDVEDVSAKDSRIKVLVIKTDEELCIAQQALAVVHQQRTRQ